MAARGHLPLARLSALLVVTATPALGAEPAHLRVAQVSPSSAQLSAQQRQLHVSVELSNEGGTPACLLDASLRFKHEGPLPQHCLAPERYYQRFGLPPRPANDLTNQWWCVLKEPLPKWVPPGERAAITFRVEALDGVTPGAYQIVPEVTWYDHADNLVTNGEFEASAESPPPGWEHWRVPDDAKVSYWVDQDDVKGRQSPRSYVMDFAPQKGRYELALLTTSPFPVRPNTTYRCGLWVNAAGEPSVKQLLIPIEVDRRAQSLREEAHWVWYETPGWFHDWVRFTTSPAAERMRVSLRLEAFGEGKREAVWWDGVYVLPEAAIKTAPVPEPGSLEVPPRASRRDDIGLAYLGADWETQGDWQPHYGNEAFILCAMISPEDFRGTARNISSGHWRSEGDRPLEYNVWTSDPNDTARLFLGQTITDDPRALYNPVGRCRTYSSWDDHGEVHPFDSRGPDLYVSLAIPEGEHRLSLYFVDRDWHNTPHPRQHRVEFISEGGQELLAFAVREFGSGVYHSLAVRGPQTVRFVIEKGPSVSSILSGIFLDRIPAWEARPEGWNLAEAGPAPPTTQADLETWQELRELIGAEAPAPDSLWRAWQLARRLPAARAERVEIARRLVRAAVDDLRPEAGSQSALKLFQHYVAADDLRAAAVLAEPVADALRRAAPAARASDTVLPIVDDLLPYYRATPQALAVLEAGLAGDLQALPAREGLALARRLAERFRDIGWAAETKALGEHRSAYAAAELALAAAATRYGREAFPAEDLMMWLEMAQKQWYGPWHRERILTMSRYLLQRLRESPQGPQGYWTLIQQLVSNDRLDEADALFREAWGRYPHNGWLNWADDVLLSEHLPRLGQTRDELVQSLEWLRGYMDRHRESEGAWQILPLYREWEQKLAGRLGGFGGLRAEGVGERRLPEEVEGQ